MNRCIIECSLHLLYVSQYVSRAYAITLGLHAWRWTCAGNFKRRVSDEEFACKGNVLSPWINVLTSRCMPIYTCTPTHRKTHKLYVVSVVFHNESYNSITMEDCTNLIVCHWCLSLRHVSSGHVCNEPLLLISFQDLAAQTSSDAEMEFALMRTVYVTMPMTVEMAAMNLDVVSVHLHICTRSCINQ